MVMKLDMFERQALLKIRDARPLETHRSPTTRRAVNNLIALGLVVATPETTPMHRLTERGQRAASSFQKEA